MAFKNDGTWGMKPRKPRGGIQARSQRGAFGKNWWARRWITAMERLVDSRRLSRGQHYARAGQVLSMEETPEGIVARVQGSRPTPYKVTIKVTPLTNNQWRKVLDQLAGQAIFAAQLLAGEMPADIEDAFSAAEVSLFPARLDDLQTTCSCPDYANPCKHVAAAHYILGERFDDDPFLLFRMRGRTQEEILVGLRERRAGRNATPTDEREVVIAEIVPLLEEYLDQYWEPGPQMNGYSVQVRPPVIPLPLLQRLGEPEGSGAITLQGQLEDAYQAMTQFALSLAYGDFSAPSSADDDE